MEHAIDHGKILGFINPTVGKHRVFLLEDGFGDYKK